MLTKSSEKLLKKLLNNNFNIPDELITNTSENLVPKSVIIEQSPLKRTQDTELALLELEEQGFLKKEAIFIYLTTSGKTYFDLQKITRTNKIIWNIAVPAVLGFVGGTLPIWFNVLIKWLL